MQGQADFVDAVAFGAGALVLNRGRFVEDAPTTSDYTYERIYYRSLLETEVDHLRTRDYLWRWDTDWFWCSKNFGAQHPWLRRLLGAQAAELAHLLAHHAMERRLGLTRRWARWRGDTRSR